MFRDLMYGPRRLGGHLRTTDLDARVASALGWGINNRRMFN
jgi:hypothetical protein